jgi:hypothetical protein
MPPKASYAKNFNVGSRKSNGADDVDDPVTTPAKKMRVDSEGLTTPDKGNNVPDLAGLKTPGKENNDVVILVEAKGRKPLLMPSRDAVEEFKKACPSIFIGFREFASKEEADRFCSQYNVDSSSITAINSPNDASSPDKSPEVASVPSSVNLASKMKSFINKQQRKCVFVVTAFAFAWTENVIVIIRFQNRDGKDYWCHKADQFANAAQAYAEFCYGTPTFGTHTHRDVLKTMRSVALRDRMGGPNDRLKVRRGKDAYSVYALSGVIVNPERKRDTATTRIKDFLRELQTIAVKYDFQQAYHLALGDSLIWSKMGGYQAEYWKDIVGATVAIEYELEFSEVLCIEDAERFAQISVSYNAKDGLPE